MNVFKNLKINGEITDIICENGVISAIKKTDMTGIDFGGLEAKAGLVDIHTHGGGGIDVLDCKLEPLADFYAKHGVTTFLPTTTTDSTEKLKAATDCDINVKGAKIPGFHMEGPYINPIHKGAQNEAFIKAPTMEEFKSFKNVKMITVAPEAENAIEFIKECGVKVCIGHSNADYDLAAKAMDAGADCLTHTFNAMTPLTHRNPGIIGAAADKGIYAQVICDGIHIHPAVIRILYKVFGPDRMVLISDSIRSAGLPDGEYELGGLPVFVKNSVARLENGALAGSCATLFYCVQKAIEFGIPKEDAYKMASETPANLLGLKTGKLETGYDCDFIVLNQNGSLFKTVIAGEIYE